MDLHTCRSFNGFDEGPIPWSAVNCYAIRYSFSDEGFEELWYFIKEMDKTYLNFIRNRRGK